MTVNGLERIMGEFPAAFYLVKPLCLRIRRLRRADDAWDTCWSTIQSSWYFVFAEANGDQFSFSGYTCLFVTNSPLSLIISTVQWSPLGSGFLGSLCFGPLVRMSDEVRR